MPDDFEILLGHSFVEGLGADSLDLVELTMSIEEEFGLEIDDDEVEKILTVGDALGYIATHDPMPPPTKAA